MSGTGEAPARYLAPSDVLRLAREELGPDADPDSDALYLAVRRTAEGDPAELAEDLHRYGAALLEGLISFHPFTVGNERIALLAVTRFYAINGWMLDADEEVHRLVADMSAGRASVFAAAAVLARHVRPLTP